MAKSVEEVAQEVIKGLWGNGTDRRAKLTSAGYDYSEVQTAVNKLLINSTTDTSATSVSKKYLEVTVNLNEYDGINLTIER